ncbi:hypothetical protein KR009_008882 [Drosophila setifemur]|nr:hypothetical protein KR009_008882 [Drosophila setifemur]
MNRIKKHTSQDFLIEESQLSKKWHVFKASIMVTIWTISTIILFMYKPMDKKTLMVTVLGRQTVLQKVHLPNHVVKITLEGPVDPVIHNPEVHVLKPPTLSVRLEWRDVKLQKTFVSSQVWNVHRVTDPTEFNLVYKNLDISPRPGRELGSREAPDPMETQASPRVMDWASAQLVIAVENKEDVPMGVKMTLDPSNQNQIGGVAWSVLLMVALYAMVILEFADHTLCALILATAGLAILTYLDKPQSLENIISYLNMATMMLLLGIMIMMSFLSETGIFEYMTVLVYRISKGHAWLLIFLLCTITVMLCLFLGAETVVLMLAPTTIHLCEALQIQTVFVLTMMAIFATMAEVLTPVGGTPNMIIMNHLEVQKEKLDFLTFTARMFPGCIVAMLIVFVVIYIIMRKRIYNISATQRRLTIRHQVDVKYNEEQVNRIADLRAKQDVPWITPVVGYYRTLTIMEAEHPIRDIWLLVKTLIALVFCMAGFAFYSTGNPSSATVSWVAFLGVFLLVIIVNSKDLSRRMMEIDWSILLWISGVLVISETADKLGFVIWICDLVIDGIAKLDKSIQPMASVSLVIWSSAILSALYDNSAVSNIMIKVCVSLAQQNTNVVELRPLIYALCYGVNFGGNGSPIGSLPNEFVELVARQYGYQIRFHEFFIISFPLMIVSLTIAWLSLLSYS